MSHKPSAASSGFSSGGISTISSGTLSIQAGVQSTFWDNIFDEEDDENQEQDPKDLYHWKDCIIFLIDCQAPMFQENDNGEIPFHNAIKCVISTLTDKIISSENDVLGVCFYGTEKKKNQNDFENIYVLFDLDSCDAQKILDLEALIDGEFDLGHATKEFAFSDALWTCSTMFSNCPIKVAHKRIFLFTNEDNPNASNANLRDQSFQRAKDLAELGIDIELFSMNKLGERFNFNAFYDNIISVPEDEDTGGAHFDAAAKFEELKARVRRKEFKKRNISKLPFYIGAGDTAVTAFVKLYSLVQETKKGGYTHLDSKNNQPVKLTSKLVCADTGTLLMDYQIKYAHEYGGENIIFDKDEVKQLKTLDEPGIRLMGFKPRSSLKFHHNLKHSSFIYPDETAVKGSTTFFAALLDRMLASEKIGIVRLTPRGGSPPRFCALLPQDEVLDEDGSQFIPSGFHLIPLPYADDLRALRLDPPRKVEKDQITKAKKIVKALRIKFDSRNFENPALQKHYADLQALALERNYSEEVVDYVLPDVEGMSKFQELVEDFKVSVFAAGYEYIAKTPKKAGDGKGLKRKKALADVDWVDICDSGAVNRLTVVELKEFIKCQNLKTPSKSKKENLVQVVVDHVKSGKLKMDLLPKFGGADDDMDGDNGRKPEDNEEEDARAKKRAKIDKDDDPILVPQTTKSTTTTTSTTKTKNTTNDSKKPKPIWNDDEEEEDEGRGIGRGGSFSGSQSGSQSMSNMSNMSNSVSNSADEEKLVKKGKMGGGKGGDDYSSVSSVGSVGNSVSSVSQSVTDEEKLVKKGKPIGAVGGKPSLQHSSSSSGSFDTRPICRYGTKCYRTNTDHVKQFQHPKE